MAFRFPLAAVLRVRTIQEEREERMLQQIQAEIAQVTNLQADVEAGIARVSAARQTHVTKQLTGAALHSHYGELAALRQTLADLQLHHQKLEALKEKQLNIYENAHRKREMLSGLDDTQRAEHDIEMTKREQKTLDDIFGARLRRR